MSAEFPTVVEMLTARARSSASPGSDVLEKVRVVLGDALAVALQASGTPTARTMAGFAAAAPPGPATAIGCPRGVAVESAVLINSALIHALLLDDAHPGTMVHPGTVVLPLALALAEETGASGEALVGAIAAGYETFVGIAAPVASQTAVRGFRNTALFGAAGAAAAAATLLGLDDERFAAAVLIACGSSGGTLQAFRAGSPEWRFQPGVAAQNGLSAARLAAVLDHEQLPFPADALEGENGLYATLTGQRMRAAETPSRGGPAILEVSHKAHATCGANQLAVGALSAILRGSDIEVDDVVRVEVGVSLASYEYPGCEHYGPFSPEGTFLSRPLAIAATLLAGGGPLGASELRAALAHPRLDAVLSRVISHVLPAAGTRGPQDAVVEVVLADGTVRRAGVDDVDPLELAPDWDAVRRRLRAAAPEQSDALIAAIEGLPATTARELLGTLRVPRRRTGEAE